MNLNVLSLEDSPQDLEIIREQLIDSGYIINMDCTAKEKEFISLLRSHKYDIILSDFNLPGYDGFAALRIAKEICPDTPFICVSGTIGEDNAVELLKEGAVDYVLKDRLERLPHTIHRALEEVKEKKARKEAEYEVKKTQVLLQASIESPKDMAILSINTNYDYLVFNTFHKEFMNFTYGVDVNIGMNQLNCITNETDRLNAKNSYDRAFTGKSFITIEEHESNKGQFYEKRYNPIYNENDEIIGATVFSANITNRKKTEEALIESECIFNAFMEYSPIYIFFKDQNAKPLRLSRNYEQLLGIPTEEAIGKTMLDLFPSEVSMKMIEDDLKVIKSGKPIRVIEEINNRYYESTKFPIVIKNHPTLLAGFTVDITDRKAVESKIQKLNEELELKVAQRTLELSEALTLVENIMLSTTVGFSVFNAKGDCILANNALAKMLETTKDQLLKQNQHNLEFWKETGLYELSINSISEQVNNSKEILYKTAIGKEVWLDYRFTPFIANNKYNLLVTVSDINERVNRELEIKELNEELQTNIEKLEYVNKELEAFSYSVSHDLRAPLRAIHGFIQILQEDFKDKLDAEGLRLMSIVSENANRMGQLIDDLLAFSRVSRSKIQKSKVNTKALVDSVLFESTSKDQREKINFDLGELPDIIGDINLLRQVWTNLISNALKYSSKIDNPAIEIGYKENSNDYEFYIKDNGAGFDMQYINKLFQVFQRLHNNREFEGTGVGLAIVHHIVSRHGGKVWAIGEVDKGATFFFTIPK